MRNNKVSVLLLICWVICFSKHAFAAIEPVSVTINAVAGLQFDLVRFQVKPGAEVRLTFVNNDDMSHNLVFTRPGAREEIVAAALNLGEQGPKMNFIPDSPKVLWAVPVLSPEETKVITFKAPSEPGVYPYVCTYPGHGFVMYGAMYVTNEAMPPIQNDLNIAASRRKDGNPEVTEKSGNAHSGHAAEALHPYKLDPPYLYRVFIPDAGPAAIAVHLPQKISYCWDAGSCRLRYAWQGGFLDNTAFWEGHKDAYAKVLGDIFYRDKTDFPIRIGDGSNLPVAKFKGYRLVNRYPEFHYFLDGVEVFELLKPKQDGTGLIRTFRIAGSGKTVWFAFDPEDGVIYTTAEGKVIKEKVKLSSGKPGVFSIVMTRKEGAGL